MRPSRKIVRGLAAFLAIVAAIACTLPWWLPMVVAFAGRSVGVNVGAWTTHGWREIVYRDVVLERDGLRVTIDELRAPPLVLWPRAAAPARDVATKPKPVIIAHKVTVVPPPPREPRPPPPSARELAGNLLRTWQQLRRWLPPAEATDVAIAIPDQPIAIQHATWDGTTLWALGSPPKRREQIELTVTSPDATHAEIEAAAPDYELRVAAHAALVAEAMHVAAEIHWKENGATAQIDFGATGLLPQAATLDAPTFAVPATDLGLANYGPVHGELRATWSGGSYSAHLAAAAEPLADAGDLPPVSVDVRADGNLERLRIAAAAVRAPGVQASLSGPVTLELPQLVPASPAAFTLEVDLAAVPRVAARGRLTGRVDVNGGPNTEPSAEFRLSGEKIEWRDAAVSSVALAGHWRPPQLQLEQFDVVLAKNSELHAKAQLDLSARTITRAEISGRAAATALRPWLKTLPQFEFVSLTASASGPFAKPQHQGTFELRGLAGLPGGALGGDIAWTGAGIENIELHGEARSVAGASLPFAATLAREPTGAFTAELQTLRWSDAQGEWWRLVEPARVRFEPAGANSGGAPTLALSGVRLEGDRLLLTASASSHWPAKGEAVVTARGIDAARVAAFLPDGARGVRLDSLEANASWDEGPVALAGMARASYAPHDEPAYWLETEFRTEREDLAFAAVRVLDNSGVVLEGRGRLPLALVGRASGFAVQLPNEGCIELDLNSTPNPQFWKSIATLTGWQIDDPKVTAHITGSLRAPRGRAELAAAAVMPPRAAVTGGAQLPHASDFHAVVIADDRGVSLSGGQFAIEDNWLTLTAHAPWQLWRTWREENRFDWRAAEFAVAAAPMPVAVFSKVFPTALAPEGSFSIDLAHAADRGFSGRLWLHGAATRPIEPVGTARDINGELLFDGYKMTLVQLSAMLGGRPLRVTGAADFAQLNAPAFDVQVTSDRAPIVRQPGLVLRASLGLRAQKTPEKPAHISGRVEFGPSVYVSDLVSLIPTGGVETPERRPPYFSVSQEPFSQWTLDVEISGDDFLRVQNPLFGGTVSADFHLRGTLAEPRALGRVTVNEGAINFPFARVPLQSLDVALTPENPYRPIIQGTGGARLFGYDVHMELSGPATEPRLLFTSDPPMASQDVFLMLTTGELPESEQGGFTTAQRAQRLAFFIGRNLAGDLGLIPGGDGADRLTIRSDENFSREGRETLYVQYDLDERWALFGEYDRFDAYNGGIKFRLIDR